MPQVVHFERLGDGQLTGAKTVEKRSLAAAVLQKGGQEADASALRVQSGRTRPIKP